jgi:hypothetical protein
MASKMKIAANRKNALKSSGPKSAAGKSRSSLNALKYGAFTKVPVLWGEDASEHRLFVEQLTQELAPKTAIEGMLADQIAGDMWRLKRIETAERAYFDEILSSRAAKLLQSLTDEEFDLAGELLNDWERFDLVMTARQARRLSSSANTSLTDFLDQAEQIRKKPEKVQTTAEQKAAVREIVQNKMATAGQLGPLLLESLASPAGATPYAQLDRQRRLLTRDIIQKHQALLALQHERAIYDHNRMDDALPPSG